MTEEEVLYILSLSGGFNAALLMTLKEERGDLTFLLDPKFGYDTCRAYSVSSKALQKAMKKSRKTDAAREISRVRDKGFDLVSIFDESYPESLKEIYDPPLMLYVKGGICRADSLSISIVGARRATIYGMETAERFAGELAACGFTVISGLAAGIDAAGHRGALGAGGRTVAVLGCGVDVIYPKENKDLYEEIAKTGAVISEYPLGTIPKPFNFPKRNRIIAGLSLGTVVVEAYQRSGSLITAKAALDEGREVYAVPGRINSLNSIGTNELIKNGAKIITRVEDILADNYHLLTHSIKHEAAIYDEPDAKSPEILEEEDRILESISYLPQPADLIAFRAGLAVERVLNVLTKLELEGKIKRMFGGMIVKVKKHRTYIKFLR